MEHNDTTRNDEEQVDELVTEEPVQDVTTTAADPEPSSNEIEDAGTVGTEALEDEPAATVTSEPAAAPTGRWSRPTNGRILAGVAVGVAQRTELPLWFVRTAFVITTFAGGFGLAAYLAAWALMPSESGGVAAADNWRTRFEQADSPSKKFGLGLIGLGVLIAIGATGLLSSPLALAAVMVVVGMALLRPTTNHQ